MTIKKKAPPKKKPAKKKRKAASKNKRLTNQEAVFKDAIVAGEHDNVAYRLAYKTRANDNTVRKEAHTIRKRPHVKEAIRIGQEEAAKRAEITAETLIEELEEARQVSKVERSGSGMTAATMGKAKLLGLDKIIVEIKDAEKLTPWSSITVGIDKGAT